MSDSASRQANARWILGGTVVLIAGASILLWRYTPLAQWADPQRIAALLQTLRDSAWAPFAVIGAFIVGGLIVFPLTFLIAATAIVFDPPVAIALSLTGSLANAVILYLLGRLAMRDTVMHAFATAVEKLRGLLTRSGILAVAAIRMVPIAPFTLVNLAAGAIGVRLRDYVLGTLLGLLPGTIVLTAFGHQLREIIERPTLTNVGALLVVIVAWIGVSIVLQRWTSRRKSTDPA